MSSHSLRELAELIPSSRPAAREKRRAAARNERKAKQALSELKEQVTPLKLMERLVQHFEGKALYHIERIVYPLRVSDDLVLGGDVRELVEAEVKKSLAELEEHLLGSGWRVKRMQYNKHPTPAPEVKITLVACESDSDSDFDFDS